MAISLKIGIAEDEFDMREFYQIVIPEMGHELLWAAKDGAELVDFAKRARPDMLIVDIRMPLLDGLDAVHALSRTESLPVIVVSGHHDRETMERAEAERLMGYLIKPIREADLRAAIAIASERFAELREVREKEARQLLRIQQAKRTVRKAIHTIASAKRISPHRALVHLRTLAEKEQRTLSEVSQTIIDSVDSAVAN